MLSNNEKLIAARFAGNVERAHTIRHLGSYTTAQHQWGVAMLLWYLFRRDYWKLSIFALTHDLGEYWFGDVPATTKKFLTARNVNLDAFEEVKLNELDLPLFSELLPEEQRILKACDGLELWLWCQEQLALGNTLVSDCEKNIRRYLLEADYPESIRATIELVRNNGYIPPTQCLGT